MHRLVQHGSSRESPAGADEGLPRGYAIRRRRTKGLHKQHLGPSSGRLHEVEACGKHSGLVHHQDVPGAQDAGQFGHRRVRVLGACPEPRPD